MIYFITSRGSYILFKLFFSLKVSGMENVPKDRSFLIASNHVSHLDPIIFGAICKHKLFFMAKEELFKNRLFAWYLRKLNIYPIKRESSDSSALREAVRRLKKGQGVIIFPEGTRSKDGKIQEGKTGISVLSAITNVAVVPCYIKGTYEIFPSGSKWLHKGKMSVYFGKPLEPLVVNHKERKVQYYEFAQKVMTAIKLLKEKAK